MARIRLTRWGVLTQIMDGSPSRGETIPIRLFLGGFDLTPTFRDVNKKFSTRYYLSLVLIDEGELEQSPHRSLPHTPKAKTINVKGMRITLH